MKEIKLSIRKDFAGLAGRELGLSIYETNNLDEISIDEEVLLVFPDTVERIAASFVQGLLEGFIKKKGKYNTKKEVHVKMKNKKLEESFYEKMY